MPKTVQAILALFAVLVFIAPAQGKTLRWSSQGDLGTMQKYCNATFITSEIQCQQVYGGAAFQNRPRLSPPCLRAAGRTQDLPGPWGTLPVLVSLFQIRFIGLGTVGAPAQS
jgi:hypothetical protein